MSYSLVRRSVRRHQMNMISDSDSDASDQEESNKTLDLLPRKTNLAEPSTPAFGMQTVATPRFERGASYIDTPAVQKLHGPPKWSPQLQPCLSDVAPSTPAHTPAVTITNGLYSPGSQDLSGMDLPDSFGKCAVGAPGGTPLGKENWVGQHQLPRLPLQCGTPGTEVRKASIAQMHQLVDRLDDIEEELRGSLSAIAARLDVLEADLASVAKLRDELHAPTQQTLTHIEAMENSLQSALGSLTQRVDQLSQQNQALQAAAAEQAAAAAVNASAQSGSAQVNQRVAAVEQSLQLMAEAGEEAVLTQRRVGQVEERLQQMTEMDEIAMARTFELAAEVEMLLGRLQPDQAGAITRVAQQLETLQQHVTRSQEADAELSKQKQTEVVHLYHTLDDKVTSLAHNLATLEQVVSRASNSSADKVHILEAAAADLQVQVAACVADLHLRIDSSKSEAIAGRSGEAGILQDDRLENDPLQHKLNAAIYVVLVVGLLAIICQPWLQQLMIGLPHDAVPLPPS